MLIGQEEVQRARGHTLHAGALGLNPASRGHTSIGECGPKTYKEVNSNCQEW